MTAARRDSRRRVSDLSEVILRGALGARRAPALEQERDGARFDLLRAAWFRPAAGDSAPPYRLVLAAEDDRLRLTLHPSGDDILNDNSASVVGSTETETAPTKTAAVSVSPTDNLKEADESGGDSSSVSATATEKAAGVMSPMDESGGGSSSSISPTETATVTEKAAGVISPAGETEGVNNLNETGSVSTTLPLAPLRATMRDYDLLCQSYFEAIRTSSAQRIESIDMARRALHDEGASTLRDSLADTFTLNHESARLLFSLLYALRPRNLADIRAASAPAATDSAPAPADTVRSDGLAAVVFVCNSNAIRSPMAADLARASLGGGVAIFSAAAVEAREEIDGFVVSVMSEIGHSLAHWRPHALDEIEPQLRGLGAGVTVVALSRGAETAARDLAERLDASWQRWRISDPSRVEGVRQQRLDATRAARDAIAARIRDSLTPMLARGAEASSALAGKAPRV